MTPPLIITSASTSSSLVDGEEQPELRTSSESLLSLKSSRPRWRKSVGDSVVLFNGSSSSLNLLGEDEDKEVRTEMLLLLSLSLPQSAKYGFE